MEIESQEPEAPRGKWPTYIAALLIAISVLLLFQLANIRSQVRESKNLPGQDIESLATGDFYCKVAIAFPGRTRLTYARSAIMLYDRTLPSPAGYRRIGVTRQVLLGESGRSKLDAINSPEAIEGLSRARKRSLAREVAMWDRIYGAKKLSREEAEELVPRIRKLNLGPLKEVAVADVYSRAGMTSQASAAVQRARSNAIGSIIGFAILACFIFCGGLIGLILGIYYLWNRSSLLARTPNVSVRPMALLLTFFAYLGSFFGFSLLMNFICSMGCGSGTAELLLEAAAMVGSFAIGLAVLQSLNARDDSGWRDIGYRIGPINRMAIWGVGGYCVVLPLVGATSWLSNIVFSGYPTPVHPLIPQTAAGGPLSYTIILIMGVILAPIIEETFFRGALYNSLRGQMGVWSAATLSGSIFALVHPTLPGQFLPIMSLGIVLAILREETGSLVPSMICHALFNGVTLVLVRLLY